MEVLLHISLILREIGNELLNNSGSKSEQKFRIRNLFRLTEYYHC